ncbi:MAG: acetate--CoA ligase [Deltaproteobacteria bacterium]|nr:acetate--CoA ligase [Deltaproteobacteria bacterium]
MERAPIRKGPFPGNIEPNLQDYAKVRAEFSWEAIRGELDGLPDNMGLNMAHEAVDRHATGPRAQKAAMRWLGKDGTVLSLSYCQLMEMSNRFANALRELGVAKGKRVFVLTGRIPPLYITALGTLKHLSVFCPLFSAFGPEPIYQRLARGDAKVLVTTEPLYGQKVAGLRTRLPGLKHILLTDAGDHTGSGVWSLEKLMCAVSPQYTIPPTDPEDMAILHFTSGTTGMPKGAVHVHDAVCTHYMTGKYVLDLHPDDVFWCTADPGWVTGTSYGIIAPLVCGVTSVVDESDFEPERWYRILEAEKVSVLYTAPTAIRRLMRMDMEPRRKVGLDQLRLIHSVGEPLNPEAVLWGQRVLGLPIHDNWWQTETGGIMIANFPSVDIRPGSMGLPVPGIEAAVAHRPDADTLVLIEAPNVQGELVLKVGWPSMFRGYLHEKERYRKCFAGGWYVTGDLVRRDEDGYFWFVGRADDVIKTSGQLVGPFEVERVLMEHPAVVEAAVIGKPHPMFGEVVKGFICLKTGIEPSDALRLEILGFARKRLGAVVAPKELQFHHNLPKNKAGKIMRRLLKAREMGLPEGDTSTLEGRE